MRHNCASCGHHTTEVMDFGRVALAGAFVKPEQFADEKYYPLTLRFCEQCLLLQTGQVVAPETMFGHYFYFSSATQTMRKHFEAYARQVVERFHPKRVLEIGCNDGVLLRPLQQLGVRALGVDPAQNVTEGLDVINAFWGMQIARSVGTFDLILANNVFAHIADINDACAGVALALEHGGSFVFEVNRLDSLVADLQYDWVYHEHRYYYSLLALDSLLARHGMEVYDLQRLGTHAGSIRYFAGNKGVHTATKAVADQRDRERWHCLDRLGRFTDFAERAAEHRAELRALVARHERVVGYGACGRTNTMLQFCGLGARDIGYIVDDAPAKQGLYTPGSHIPITSAAALADEKADCLIVFAWSFLTEIQPKLHGFPGKVVVPLPHIYEQKERQAA